MTPIPLSVSWIVSNLPCQILGDLYLFSNQIFQGVSQDSRKIKPGFLFVAVPGTNAHGGDYVSSAISQGATGVLSDLETCMVQHINHPHLPFIAVPDVRFALTQLASLICYERPEFIAAVTGTNGKSSVVSFARQLWGMLGKPAASLGTLGVAVENAFQDPKPLFGDLPTLTTLDPLSLHACLEILQRDLNVEYLALEAASHGLDQKRLDGLQFQAVAFTNFSRDHLDYHGSLEHYFEAKLRLFTDLVAPHARGVLWADMPYADVVRKRASCALWSYGYQGEEIRLLACNPTPEGQVLDLLLWGQPFSVFLPLVGTFQAMNALAALGIVVASGFLPEQVVPLLAQLKGVSGRVERVGTTEKGACVYVDFAHTPDGLKSVLEGLRAHTAASLWLVFGCGGDRDPGKRNEMGTIAGQFADHVVVTDDNPRYEDPARIRSDILKGCPKAHEVEGRKEAIAYAIESANAGDLIVIAGKGHEHYQQIGSVYHIFQDADVVRSLLSK